jgi:hypothetical protein
MPKTATASRFVGIVGHEAAKFTPEGEATARAIIRELLADENAVLVSGHCHLGGIDIWAEEEAQALGREMVIFTPGVWAWEGYGDKMCFKQRNEAIADLSDEVHVIVVAKLPETYVGMKHEECYHCHTTDHVKSGGCWTGKDAIRRGKTADWWTIDE